MKTTLPKKQWNITILVIFVLLASGIIGMLTMHFVRQIAYSNKILNAYYKSYYLARAGVEISLTQINTHGVWFDYAIHTGDYLVQDNFDCAPNCSIQTEIFGKSPYINQSAWNQTWCNSWNSVQLAKWESLILPLFIDDFNASNNIAGSLLPASYRSTFPIGLRILYDKQWMQADQYTLWLISDGYPLLSRKYSNTDYNNNIANFLWQEYITSARRLSTGNYFLISNSSSTSGTFLKFCLHVKKSDSSNLKLALPYAHIKSIGSYQNTSLGLEALYKHRVLPDFLSHTSLDL